MMIHAGYHTVDIMNGAQCSGNIVKAVKRDADVFKRCVKTVANMKECYCWPSDCIRTP